MKKLSSFSKQQQAVLVSQAHFEVVKEEFQKRCDLAGIEEMYEHDFDKAFELDEVIGAEVGYDAAYQAYSKAKKELVEWSYAAMKDLPPFKKQWNEISKLYEYAKGCLVTRDKLVDIIMKWQAI